MQNKKILITTGIYPPKIGGPAQYAKNLANSLEKMGHTVTVRTYGIEDSLPTGIRHLFFFFKITPAVLSADIVFSLDTFSVGWPTVLACSLFGKKSVIRTGGDFLWEAYVERTKRKALLRTFYDTESNNFSGKERIIFTLTRWTLQHVSHTIFSTDWQRQIFIKAYGMKSEKTSLVENYYGPKESDEESESKTFVASTRPLTWKNIDVLQRAFTDAGAPGELFLKNVPFAQFMEVMKKSYAVVLVSLGDISPNMILDAIRFNRPFICTKEVGTYERIKDAGIFVDPLNETEIVEALREISTDVGYAKAKEKVRQFHFVHTWDQIADEFMQTFNTLQ